MEERSPNEVLELVGAEEVEFVDLRFCDLPGVMQHVSIPANVLDEGQFEDGHAFDGSSVRGFQQIQESDMVLIPDPNTAYLDPFRRRKTLVMHCYVADPVTGERYSRDPRYVAQKAQEHLFATGVADTAYFGPEPEFFIFDDVRFETTPNGAMYKVDSVEGQWNTGTDEGPNLGYKPRTKEGYFPAPPMDHYMDLRADMAATLHEVGIATELHHHEVASGGQGEIGIRFDTLLAMADNLMTFKYVLKNVAWQAGKSLTFMPKPIFEDNGSGMHTHQSLWKGGEPLFYDEAGYAGLSDLARWYIGGLLHHAHAVIAFTNPTTNSFKRLVPGYEAPVNLVYSQRNRSAACRIPLGQRSPTRQARRVPLPRLHVEPLPRLLGDDARRPRRHRQPHRAARPRWTRTSTTFRPRSSPTSRRSPARSSRPSTRSRPTATSSAPVASSPTTCSRRGSATSEATRSTPSASAPTPTSSRSTTTSSR